MLALLTGPRVLDGSQGGACITRDEAKSGVLCTTMCSHLRAPWSLEVTELAFPIWQVGRLPASKTPGVGRSAESRAAESAKHTRAGIPRGSALARWPGTSAARTPSPFGARPPRRAPGSRRPRPAPPARRSAALGGPGSRRRGARGRGPGGGEPVEPGAPGARTHAAGPAARASPPPRPGARAAVTSRAARQPSAPAGRARADAEHMGPRAGRARGGLDSEEQRGAASEAGPGYPRAAPEWISTREGCWRLR